MKLDTLIRLHDGREGRVVYSSLDGVGIRIGSDPLTEDEKRRIRSGDGCLFHGDGGQNADVYPNVMLREKYDGCDKSMEYIKNYEII